MVPLIHTSIGNVPIDSLDYYKQWTDTDKFTQFKEWWIDRATGEMVKENGHVLVKEGAMAEIMATLGAN